MNKKQVAGAVLFSAALGLGQGPDAHATTTDKANTYKAAQHFLHQLDRHGNKVPWDGRYSYNEKTELCLELFNGTDHSLTFKTHHDTPQGFYIRVCGDGNYYVNDGTPFKGMKSY